MDEKFVRTEHRRFREVDPVGGIGVAQDCGDGRDGFELHEQTIRTDVACVEDVIHTTKDSRESWVEETVCVGDEAEFHGLQVES